MNKLLPLLAIVADNGWRDNVSTIFGDNRIRDAHGRCPLVALVDEIRGTPTTLQVAWQHAFGMININVFDNAKLYKDCEEIIAAADLHYAPRRKQLKAILGL